MPLTDHPRNGAAHADLDVVGMGAYAHDVDHHASLSARCHTVR